uniref:Ig-like domain-containing protein n=1 Tax=Saimiri boliviensis boliviensis TaxID=39432 RepID=A0A2K6U7P8_SAIBB
EIPKPSIASSNSNPRKTDTVTLTCEPEIQNASYLWWINGQSHPITSTWELSNNNRTLILLSVTENDAGSYECEVRNPVRARRSDPVTLNVLHGPDVPRISPSDTLYRQGGNLHLSCFADSNPPADYLWMFNGTFIRLGKEAYFPKITTRNSGLYTCLAHNSVTGKRSVALKNIKVV